MGYAFLEQLELGPQLQLLLKEGIISHQWDGDH